MSSERNFLQIIQLLVNSLTLVADITSLQELSKKNVILVYWHSLHPRESLQMASLML